MEYKFTSKHKKRFYNSLARKGYDRLPVKHYGEPVVNEEFAEYLGLDNHKTGSGIANPCNVRTDLLDRIGDDFRYVVPVYNGPEVKHYPDGSRTATFPERGWPVQEVRWIEKKFGSGKGIYLEVAYKPFATIEDPKKLDNFDFPQADWLDYSNIETDIEKFPDHVICIDKAGPDFIGSIAYGRGMDNVFLDIAIKNPVYLKLMEIQFEYRYELTRQTLEAGKGKIDVVQTSAKDMEIEKLSMEFGKDICFCGTMDVQKTLINETPRQIEDEVRLRQRLFPDGGLILGPSHAIQPGTPMENIIAMYRSAGGLEEM